MEHKGFEIYEKKNTVIVSKVRDFNPVHIFECGQCFRWEKENDNSYTGVVKDRVINISCKEDKLIIKNSSLNDFFKIWFDYFDLARDYSVIKKEISVDEIIKKATDFGWGIRILKQDFWEVLISFILSSNNNIARIKKAIEIISGEYGEKITFNGKNYYSFPSCGELSSKSLDDLTICKSGYRCKYISLSSKIINEKKVDIKKISKLETKKARQLLMNLPGIGPKVADCILLFGDSRYNVFPVDVWIKRAMEAMYFKNEVSFNTVREFSKKYFSDKAGFAQQYLFYYARENKIDFSKS